MDAIYIGVGEEGPAMKLVVRELFERLKEDESVTDNLSFIFFPELDHGDALHLAAYDGFKTIFASTAEKVD